MPDIAVLGMAVDSRDVKKANTELDKLAGTSEKTERKVSRSSKLMGSAISAFSKVGVAGFVSVGTAAIAMGTNLANQAVELRNMANVANSTTQELQKMAYAAQGFGIDQQKVADILKDFNDRVGDFLQTGGGPMVDFFDRIAPKIGVTAEQFTNLSGADGLLLFVDSLEKANLTQQEMTFQMEAIASDSTALLPILRNNAELYRELGAEAERYGLILGDDVIANSIAFKGQLRQLGATVDGFKTKVGAEMLPTMVAFNDVLIELSSNTDTADTVAAAFGFTLKVLATAAIGVVTTIANVGRALGGMAAAANQAIRLNFKETRDIVAAFTADNEAATAKAEAAIGRLWDDTVSTAPEVQKSLSGNSEGVRVLGRDWETTGKKARDAVADMLADLQFQAATLGMTETQIALYKAALDGASLSQLNMAASLRSTIDEFKKQKEELENLDSLMERNDELITGADDATRQYGQTLSELNTLLEAGRISQDEFNMAVGRADKVLKDSKEGFDTFGELATEAAKRSQGALADFLFDPFEDGLAGMFDSFAMTLQRIIAEAAAAQIMEALLGDEKGGAGLLSGIFSGGQEKKSGGLDVGSFAGEAGSFNFMGDAGGSEFIGEMKGAFSQDGGGFLAGLGDAFSSGLSGFGDVFSGLLGSLGGLFGGGGGDGGLSSLVGAGASLFAGLFDDGGNIARGQFGIVGERGPEIVTGPANVTSRADTAKIMDGGGQTQNVNQIFNISTPDANSFRESQRQVLRKAKQGISQ